MPTQRALARPIPRNQPSAPPMRTQAQRLAGHLPPKRKAKERLQGEFVEPEAEPQKLSTHTKAKVQAIEEKERSRKLDLAKIRDQKEHERQSRLRLSHSLEGLRPKTSNRGKQPAGVATPTLFDIVSAVFSLATIHDLFFPLRKRHMNPRPRLFPRECRMTWRLSF